MTAYTKTVTGSLGFIGGEQLYPADTLFPAGDIFPFGGALITTVGHGLSGAFSASGVLTVATGSTTRLFNAVLAPTVAFSRAVTRTPMAAALSFAGSVVGVQSTHAFAKLLTAGFQAIGSLANNRVLPPQRGGGGHGRPMLDSFFTRYKPTLRKQR